MLKINEHLSSAKNPKIKNILLLQKPRERREQHVFVLEGEREISRAHQAGYEFAALFFVPEMIDEKTVEKYVNADTVVYTITASLFEKLTYRGNSDGILVLARQKSHDLDKLQLSNNPLLLVLEAIEKPGNLGAVLRTADAAALDAVIVCDASTDIYNPNVIRSSLGCLFTVPVAVASTQEVLDYLKQHKINIYSTALTASRVYHTIDYRHPSAIVVGTEADGLSQRWLKASTQNIIIPMEGIADSLNVSISAAVVVFEAKRQRVISD